MINIFSCPFLQVEKEEICGVGALLFVAKQLWVKVSPCDYYGVLIRFYLILPQKTRLKETQYRAPRILFQKLQVELSYRFLRSIGANLLPKIYKEVSILF